ncbi:fumarylacetoacetate hydrolase family protein [Pigmentiphaga litoralis]|uniref:2-keto-4-pentenoate hydratase/2-oxohepta-3-ene-1,7-dioic acid hydratase in catechol pathway n=1 Tax=Pigmentiphaga litoralis TaxID=516702 RepID=A0A7Y9ISG1_9BURK|nr:fumarylacetoacetate hydrolase family protein [Pigmentiphaga litoralis]NYE24842.1 2-keto-4-pentenoate hydratase/2-oxohepta-3-ene-1,7-dioic acid hydratase in catechol pathway [Pigmentiphaga litoralis]NYE81544.1 2-keto-4-pentenoate hydratase/2-oxohepta-3-ene-1,7-dioic acid hydratase in catechol pathway [Pigmentiphaga litoralis]
MRWMRYRTDGTGNPAHYGIVDGDRVQRVSGDPFTGYTMQDTWHAIADVTIDVPVIPRTFYCAGLNYAAHAVEAARKRGVEPNLPKQADIGYRANNALIAHGEDVVIPPDAQKMQYEGELVVVIGKQAKHLTPDTALDCVLGYTIGNDVSERVWQRSDRTLWRAKNTDTFKPMGPWIDTDFDPTHATTTVSVNGQVSTTFATNDMLFGVTTFLCAMSQYLTLWPGDVIWMGTDGSSPDLQAGDVVDVTISGLGTLTNRFVQGE